jgi:hypothetical protein
MSYKSGVGMWSVSWSASLQALGIVALAGAASLAGCGSSGNGNGSGGGGDSDAAILDGSPIGNGDAGDGGSLIGNSPTIKAITLSPLQASIVSNNGAVAKQSFTVQAQYSDGTTGALASGISWTTDVPLVGSVDGSGNYTASGTQGGLVHVTATYKSLSVSANLTVKLLLQTNTPNVPPSVQTALQGASAPDASVVWAYPYDGTVWPRGLIAPLLQWNGGAATDDYYVHIVSPTFELQQFSTSTGAPASQLAIDAATWTKFTESTSGATQITVNRWSGTAATQIASQTWTIAPASMRGTIYYWSNNLGRVLRIQPGAAAPDDFANAPPLTTLPASSCLMTCHTVSADGSTLISGGGAFGGSYDLKTGQPLVSLGGTWGPTAGGANSSSVVKWMMPAVSPDGKYILTNSMAEGLAYANDGATQGFLGMYTTADGNLVATSGLTNVPVAQPTWSPDGSRIVFVNAGDPMTVPWYSTWNVPPPGDLQVYQFNASSNPMVTGPTTLVATGTDPNHRIAWPTITPDGQWVLYSRCAGADTRSLSTVSTGAAGPSDLYFASAVTPNQEVRLAKLDGDGYPFAAGQRDLSWNFEPSFAPVAAGGYFWVVFTSRRTYGNILTGAAEAAGSALGTKQLWVAAIDQNPKPGVDPSHAAFHLEGQDETNLAMRGFWSLPPCAQNGGACQSGTDCCGGYCAGGADGGSPVCQSTPQGCSQNGDKCNQTSDCCASGQGVTCIAHVCSEPTPQ